MNKKRRNEKLNPEIIFLDFLQSIRSDFLDRIMIILSTLGNLGAVWIISTALMLCFKKSRRGGLYSALAIAIEFIICNLILKNVFARPRPFTLNTSIAPIIKPPTDFSFPSGHAGSSFAAAAALKAAGSPFWLPAGILAALISFSRLYLYVHYPTDVIAGALLGIFSGWLSGAVLRRFGV